MLKSLTLSCLSVFLLSTSLEAAEKPGSGRYAHDCQLLGGDYIIYLNDDDQTAEVRVGAEVYKNLLTSYSFFGENTPKDFYVAVLFDEGNKAVPDVDGDPGWIEIWKKTDDDSYYGLIDGKEYDRLSYCPSK